MKKLFMMVICIMLMLAMVYAMAATVTGNTVTVGTNSISVSAGNIVKCPFTPTVSANYSIYSTGSADTYGYLYNASGSTLKYNNDSGSGNNFLITYDMTAGTTYYIGVKYYSTSKSGTMTVVIEKTVTTLGSGSCGSGVTWSLNSEGLLTIGGSGAMTDYTTLTETPWYSLASSITSVVIGNNVTHIGDNAFCYVTSLKNATIGTGIKDIGKSAFYGTGLTSIVLPNSLETLGNYAFGYCKQLTQVTFGSSLKTMNNGAFYLDSALTSVVLPDSLETIGDSAFSNCSAMTEVTFGNSVKTIGNSAFSRCESLTAVVLPDSVKTIGNSAFSSCSGLTSVVLNEGLERIGQNAFDNVTNVQSFHIPSTLVEIGDSALPIGVKNATVAASNPVFYSNSDGVFSNDGRLLRWVGSAANVVISNSVTKIEPGAFSHNSTMVSVVVPGSVTSFGAGAFSNCSALRTAVIEEGVTAIGHRAFTGCSLLTRVDVPSTVKETNWYYAYCSSLQSITMSVKDYEQISRGMTCFDKDNYNLTDVYYLGSEQDRTAAGINGTNDVAIRNATWHFLETKLLTWTVNDGVLTISGSRSIPYQANNLWDFDTSAIKQVIIEDGVTAIGELAFLGFDQMTGISIADTVTRIEDSAFSECQNLTSITIPDGVTYIGYSAFSRCISLTSVSIPEGVTRIITSTFSSCSSLRKIVLPSTVTQIDSGVFGSCSALTEVAYGGTEADRETITIGSNNDYLTGATWYYTVTEGTCGENLTWKITADKTLVISGSGAMADYTGSAVAPWYASRQSIKRIELGDDVTGIGAYAFYGFSALKSITIPANISGIGNYAFASSGLTSVTIPNTVVKMGGYIFSNCSALQTAVFEEGITQIGESAFTYCDALTSVEIPSTVEETNSYYKYCWSLKEITVSVRDYLEVASGCLYIGVPTKTHSVTDVYFLGAELDRRALDGGYTVTDRAFANATWHYAVNDDEQVLNWSISDDGVLTISGNRSIPNYRGSFTQPWNASSNSIQAVVIGSGITGIGMNAFSYLKNLTRVSIPASVTYIGDYAFKDCYSLKQIVLPEGITCIRYGAFESCSALTTIALPTGIRTIEQSAFHGCSALNEVYYGGSESEKALMSIESGNDLMNSATWYYASAEGTCGNDLTWEITEDRTLVISGSGAMTDYPVAKATPWHANRFTIRNVEIGADVTSIGSYAFADLTEVESITIPGNVKSIGMYAFANSGLTNVTIPASVTNLGSRAFSSCGALKTAVIEDGIISLGSYAFENCTVLTQVEIPASVTETNYYYYNCSALKEITASVNDYGQIAMGMLSFNKGCSVTDVYFLGDTLDKQCLDRDYSVSDPGFANATWHYTKQGEFSWSISGDGVLTVSGSRSIPNCAFDYSPWYSRKSEIKSVEIKDGITGIGKYAFSNISSLTSVTIPDSVRYIEYYAFNNCDALTSVILSDSVTSISHSAFFMCSAMTDVYYGGSQADKLRVSVGSNNDGLDSAEWHYTTKSGTCGEHVTWSVEWVNGEKTLMISGDGAMSDYTAAANQPWHEISTLIKRVEISNGVTGIGKYAFAGMTALYDTVIADSVTGIGDYAFSCSGLTTVTIPGTVTSFGSRAFAGCASLRGAVIEEGVTDIGEEAFANCDTLVTVTVPASVKETNYYYSDCDALTAITVSVRDYYDFGIGKICFNDGNSITDVYFLGDELDRRSLDAGRTLDEVAFNHAEWHYALTGTVLDWSISDDGVLTVSGNRSIPCYNFSGSQWGGRKSEIRSVVIESGVTGISRNAFYGCSNIASISIPESVTSIESYAFDGCRSLTDVYYDGTEADKATITIGTSNTHLTSAVWHCAQGGTCGDDLVWKLDNSGTLSIAGTGAMTSCPWNASAVKTVVIQQGVTTIADNAFASCTNLTSVTIPVSVIAIGNNAFDQCSNLAEILYLAAEGRWESIQIGNGNSSLNAEQVKYNGHAEKVFVEAIEPNCTEEGLMAYYECTYCHAWFDAEDNDVLIENTVQLITPPNGHTMSAVQNEPATCTTSGIIEHCYVCDVCGYHFVWDPETDIYTELEDGAWIIPAINHANKTVVAASVPSCTEEGNSAYSFCSDCGKYLIIVETTEGTTCQEIEKDSWIIPRLPHVEVIVDEGMAATCTEPGMLPYSYCEECGDTLQDGSEIPPTGHTPVVTKAAITATCTAKGSTEEIGCEICHAVLTAAQETELLPHTTEIVPGYPADCVNTGLTDGTRCTVCKQMIEEQQTIPVLGHVEQSIPAVDPTCTEAGLTEGKVCKVCGITTVEQEAVPATGHTPVTIPAVTPTDIDEGATEGTCCKVCDEILTAPEVIAANFSYDETGKTVTAYNRQEADVVIPEGVTALADELFKDNTSIRTVKLSSTVTTLGTKTFNGCSGLTDIWFNDQVTTISNTTLTGVTAVLHANAESRTAVTLSQKAKAFTVEEGFQYRYRLSGGVPAGAYVTGYVGAAEELEIPATLNEVAVDNIYSNAFANKNVLKKVTIPDSVKTIAANAFADCSDTLVIRSSATAYARTYAGNNGIVWEHDSHTSAVLDMQTPTCTEAGWTQGLICTECGEILQEQEIIQATHIHDCEFGKCTGCGQYFSTEAMTVLQLPAALKQIDANAFQSSAAEAIVVPDGCIKIESHAFADCTALKYLFLPKGLTDLAENALEGCGEVELIYH